MLQFYFLSILFNFFTSLFLIHSSTKKLPVTVKSFEDKQSQEDFNIEEKNQNDKISKNSFINFDNQVFGLILGILTFLTGILKLLIVVPGDIYILGDLLPAIAGIFGGGNLLFLYYSNHSSSEFVPNKFLGKLFVNHKKYLGAFCFIISILHFLFPRVVLL